MFARNPVFRAGSPSFDLKQGGNLLLFRVSEQESGKF